MSPAFLPALAIGATVGASVVARPRSPRVKLATELVLVIFVAGVLALRGSSPLPSSSAFLGPDGTLLQALTVIWWLVAARLGSAVTVLALGRDARSRAARLVSDLVSGGIYLTAAVIVLNSVLELPVKGLVATSGVVAIVLGLALQNTLADLFAGIAVGVEQPFAVGERVAIGSQEGIVVEMNWRAIRLQTDSADVVTVPNSIVAKNEVVNRSRPSERRTASVDVPLRTTSPSERIIEILGQALLLCPAVLSDPPPTVALKAIGYKRATFGISFWVASSATLASARGQVLRQARRFLRHAGIEDGRSPRLPEIIGAVSLFGSLTGEQLSKLASGTTRRHFEPGETVFAEGSVGAALYVTVAGVLEVLHERGGVASSIGRVGPGEYLGEISMMTGDPRRVTITALTACEVIEVPRTAIETLLAEDRGLGEALERAVSRGAALLERDEAARASHPIGGEDTLMRKLRRFLHR